MNTTLERVVIPTRCKDCYYFKPDSKRAGFGYCFHFDEHVDFLIDELEIDGELVALKLRDGDSAEAYREVSVSDFCSKGVVG